MHPKKEYVQHSASKKNLQQILNEKQISDVRDQILDFGKTDLENEEIRFCRSQISDFDKICQEISPKSHNS